MMPCLCCTVNFVLYKFCIYFTCQHDVIDSTDRSRQVTRWEKRLLNRLTGRINDEY